nr:hypothetical protein [Pontibacter silvestris]
MAILTVLLAVIVVVLIHLTGAVLIHSYIWYILVFFVFVTGFTFYITRIGMEQDSDNFQVYYFSAMGFRMVLCIGVVFAYAYFIGDGKLQFVFNFFALYFLYTGFEIYSLLANLRPNLKKQN